MKTASQDSSVTSTEEADEKDPPKHFSVTIIPYPQDLPPEQQNLLKTFPWLVDLKKFYITEVPITSIRVLDKMIDLYIKHVTVSVTECLSRPNRAAKLKRSISDFMMFCHMTYTEFKPPYEHSSYLVKMSDLMAMYLDMEIKASRTGTESLPKIASKITSSFHVYFGKNYDYVLDAILKSKIINKSCWELCDLIFRRVLRDTPGSSQYVMSYIRYLLVFKIWKGVMTSADDRRRITKLATLKLQPPPGFREKLSACSLRDVLPRVPKSRTDITGFLMLAKYSVKDKVKLFLKAVADPKVYCALDRQNFVLAMDNFSKVDGKEANESNVSLIDTWSSMRIESNIRDRVRLARITEGSDLKTVKRTKHGSLNFKNKQSQLKKKKKLFESLRVEDIGEDDTGCISSFDVEIKSEDKEEMEVKDEVEEKDELEEKEELDEKEVPEVKVEIQENQVDSMQCEGDEINEVDNEVELPSSPSEEIDVCTVKPEEPHPSQSKEATIYSSVWGLQDFHSYYSNAGFDYSMDCKPNEFSPAKTPDNLDTMDFDKDDHSSEEGQTCNSMEGDSSEIYGFTPILSGEHVIKDIEALRAAEILYAKPSLVNEKKISLEYIERKKLNILHEDTLKCDEEIIEVQSKCRTYVKKLALRPWLAILKPFVEVPPRQPKCQRCWCSRCKNTLNLINKAWVEQWDIIKDEKLDENDSVDVTILEALKRTIEIVKCNNYIWENVLEEVVKKIEELIREDSEHYSLPPKKRKAPFSFSNYVKNEKPVKEEKLLKAEKSEMSYPSTPMMSIADTLEKLENMEQKGRYSSVNINHTVNSSGPINYMSNYTSQANYLKPADTKFDHTKYDMIPSECKNISEQILVPGAFTTTFITDSQEQRKFKTPAQLKEFQHFSAAQDLINFAHSSQRLYNENQEPPETKKASGRGRKRQTRQTRNSTKSTRKRKRT